MQISLKITDLLFTVNELILSFIDKINSHHGWFVLNDLTAVCNLNWCFLNFTIINFATGCYSGFSEQRYSKERILSLLVFIVVGFSVNFIWVLLSDGNLFRCKDGVVGGGTAKVGFFQAFSRVSY